MVALRIIFGGNNLVSCCIVGIQYYLIGDVLLIFGASSNSLFVISILYCWFDAIFSLIVYHNNELVKTILSCISEVL